MDDKPDLKKIEQKTLLAYHGDGLMDLLLGILLIIDGFLLIDENVAIMGAMAAVMVPVMARLKMKITFPRIGYTEFYTKEQRRKRTPLRIALIVFLLAGIFFAIMSSFSPDFFAFVSKYIRVIFGLIIVSFALVLARSQHIRRLYAYVAVIAACFVAGHFITLSLPYYLIIIGVVIAVTGTVLLASFIKKYPLPQKEHQNG